VVAAATTMTVTMADYRTARRSKEEEEEVEEERFLFLRWRDTK
jgi:hypothetical protein